LAGYSRTVIPNPVAARRPEDAPASLAEVIKRLTDPHVGIDLAG
jgi:hypothetical protein